MKEKENEVEGFYLECAKLLGCDDHTYEKFPFRKRTRWNNRMPGNGRYEGYGIIRMYAPNSIHVMLNVPRVRGYFKDATSVFQAIKTALNS